MSEASFSELLASSRETAQQIFDLANSYHEAAIRCCEPVFNPSMTNKAYAPTIAGVTNVAFSCELYLKVFAWQKNENPKKTHRLDKLYNDLTAEKQKSLRRRYSEIASVGKLQLKKDILSFSDVFLEWRYIYENEYSVRLDRLFFLAESLYYEIREANPDWIVVNQLHERILKGPDTMAKELLSLGGGKYGFR